MKRKPALAGWAGAAILVALVGVAGIVWQWRRADHHAAQEMRQRQRMEATLVRLEMEQAEILFAQDRVAAAVAQLARLLRRHPDNQVIAERLLSALGAGDFGQPSTASSTNLTTIDGGEIRRRQPLALGFVHTARSPKGICWAEFSPDGQRVVTASADSTARVWDARTGRPVTEPLCHQAGVRVARFSPDDRLVATASDDASARVWDARTGVPLTPPLGHADRVVDVGFSPDGRWIVSASLDGTARVWEARTGQPVGRPLQCGKAPIASLEEEAFATEFSENAAHKAGDRFTANFSPEGRRVVTTCPDGGVRLWDPVTGQMIGRPLAHPGFVTHFRFSRDGSRLVMVSADGMARVFDTHTGQPVAEPVSPAEGVGKTSPSFSPDGCRVITLSGNTAHIWDLRTGQPVGSPMMRTNRLVAAQFSPDGARLVLTSVDGTVHLWDVQAAVRVSGPLPQGGEVRHAEFSPDGQRLLTASSDGRARLWEVPVAPAPIPRWLPDLAEAVVGQRLTENDVRGTVSPERLQNLKQQLTAAAGTDFYARWAKWFFAPSATRALSPSCPITVPQYVERRMEEGALEGLREAVRLAPANVVALARLGLATLAQSEAENPRRIQESEGLLHQAMELAPRAPKVLRARVEWLDRMDKPAEAFALVEEALQNHADIPELWQAKGELLAKTNRLEDANLAFTQALKLAGTETPLRALRQQLLQQRSDLLRRLKRPADALADYRRLVEAAYPTARECRDQAWLNLFGPRAQRDPPERTLLLAEKAVRLDPKDWRNFRLLGMAQYRNGHFTAAAEALQAEGRLRHGRLSPQTLFYLAMTHHKLGQLDQARAYFRQAEKWWKTTFERLDRSREKGEADDTVDTPARKRRYGETAWMVQIGQITQLEDVYARLGLPAQAQLWPLRSEVERVLGMPMFKHKWKVVSVSFEVPWIVGRAAGAIDENPVTLWHTCPREGEHVLPQEIVVDLGELLELTAFTYLPRLDESPNGIVDQYEFYLSTDGQDWKEPAAKGTFTNLKVNRSLRTVPFARPVTARYFRFVGLHAVAANHLRVAELGVVEK